MSWMARRARCEGDSLVTGSGPRTPAAMTTLLVVTSVSQATREYGSAARNASRTVSLIRSATLSGWPSETDSEVNRNSPVSRMNLSCPWEGDYDGSAARAEMPGVRVWRKARVESRRKGGVG